MFDKDGAKEFLFQKEQNEKEDNEKQRQNLLNKVISILKDEFSGQNIEIFLVGSITKPYSFGKKSDIDIILKNFKGDRFELWSLLESKIGQNIEVILYEKCHFKDHIEKEGLKVL